ncbi:LptF/LptG family permease [Tichowtungia aerotolerans]|uniref:LptF/LptG family permease n=1 Tax=Tichowtungia aerotolerans TaxID=2697043 RepID=A0A6P1M5N5_9BACT|nr:LptF/LptG family permease [Tichowtungia aerotolerans]QHI67914.1 LptF/LptG family permease [Tichowtungia aerotolerans]
MRVLNRYLLFDYLVIFLTALGLITFVMTIGAMVKAVDLMARGISPMLIVRFFFQNVPYILSFSMPISILFAALLLFGRLSMDSEISAMKACGLSLWQVVAPLIVLSVLLSGICVYINNEVAPQAKYANKRLLSSAGVDEPINLLEEGRFIREFPGLLIYVGRKNGHEVKDVVAYELSDDGQVKRSLRAKRGEIEADDVNKILRVRLYDGSMETPDLDDPHDISKTTYTPFRYVQLPPLDFKELLKDDKIRVKHSYMTTSQLIDNIRNVKKDFPMLSEADQAVQRCKLMIEANRRISIAMACFTFMLIGIPLGVKSHRKETSIGMVMSLGIVFAYYIFIVIAKALADYPGLHPNLILWLPLVATQILGFVLIHRSG